MSLLFRHRLVARFRDCDPLGHVNHAAYLTYCEEARFTLWRAQLGFLVGEEARLADPSVPGFILARAEVDYHAEVRYGQELEVRLNLDAIGRTSFAYRYDLVTLPAGTLVATAKTVLVLFDYREGKPVPIDESLRAKLAVPVEERPTSV